MPLSENVNLESIQLVWLDDMVDATQEHRELQDRLRSIVNYVKTFDNCEACEKYLRNDLNQEQDRVILIVSGRLGQAIIDQIHKLKSITSIIVYCFDREKNELWAKKYKEVRAVCTQVNELLRQIEVDCKSNEFKFSEPMEILSDENDIIRMLLFINDSLIDRKQFLKICAKEYQGSLIQLGQVQDFEHLYSSSKALSLFFQESFLYRLLIKSLQTFNIDMLFLLRFYLQDIEQQLQQCPTVSVPVYRGQLMTNDQLESLKNSINQTNLRFNSYIIAKLNQEQVLNSLQNATNSNNLNRILFHIEPNQIGKQYEQNILFPITTQFRITSIDYQNEIHTVKIIVSNSISPCVTKKSIKPIALGYRLRDLGQLDDAEKIFNRLLSQQPRENSQIYDGLARIAQDKGLYEKSLQFYEKSLSKISPKQRSHCLNSIGCIYDYLKKYDLALEFYSNALAQMANDVDRAMCYNNIGVTLANQQHYEKALRSFEQSLAIRQKLLPPNHPDLGISLANMGAVLSSIGQTDDALGYYEKALKVFVINPSNIYQAIICQNMAEIFYEQSQWDQALNYYKQAASILRKTRPPDCPNLVNIERFLDQLTQMQ